MLQFVLAAHLHQPLDGAAPEPEVTVEKLCACKKHEHPRYFFGIAAERLVVYHAVQKVLNGLGRPEKLVKKIENALLQGLVLISCQNPQRAESPPIHPVLSGC